MADTLHMSTNRRILEFGATELETHDVDALRHVQQMRANSLDDKFTDEQRIASKDAADRLERQLTLEVKLLNDPERWFRIHGRFRI